MLRQIKTNAAIRNIEFGITLEYIQDLIEKQGYKCKLSGLPLQIGARTKSIEWTASLDRIDSKNGYIPGNVQWVLKAVNRMKQDYTDEEFVAVCHAVAANDAKTRREAKNKAQEPGPLLF